MDTKKIKYLKHFDALRRRQATWVALWVASALGLFAGCGELDSGNTSATSSHDTFANGDASWTGDAFSADAADAVIVNTRCPSRDAPTGDDDNDGLTNELEDHNRNCQYDPSETFPDNPDTDSDGLLDGQEDINGNGIVDFGELDPRLPDTNADGVLDTNEPLALVCNRDLLGLVQSFTLPSMDVSVALPYGFNVTPGPLSQVAFINDASHQAFGFLVLTRPESAEVTSEQKRIIEQVVRETGLPLDWRSQRAFVTPSDNTLLARPAASGVLKLSTNTSSALSPGQSRDTLLSTIAGEAIRTELPETQFCETIELHIVSFIQENGRLLTAGVFACESAIQERTELSDLVQDLTTASLLAPAILTPSGYHCQQQAVKLGAGDVDILWVVDNSASMRDERDRIQRLTQALIASLQASPMNWRLGVTSTESYLLDNTDRIVDLVHDDRLDVCSGLRGGGFLTPDSPDVAGEFERLTLEDIACDLSDVSAAFPLDANLCGATEESGLLSAALTLRRTDPLTGLCGEKAQRRKDARQVIFWLSDEDDWLLADPSSGLPLAADDPQRHTFTRTISSQFKQLGVVGCAVVGDLGVEAGGQCGAFTSESGVGARDGLGYREVVTDLGGVSGSLCGRGDSQTLVNGCLGAVAGYGQRYEPERAPIFSGMRVAVDGVELKRGVDWERDPATQAIILKGVKLNERSRVAVAFMRWQ